MQVIGMREHLGAQKKWVLLPVDLVQDESTLLFCQVVTSQCYDMFAYVCLNPRTPVHILGLLDMWLPSICRMLFSWSDTVPSTEHDQVRSQCCFFFSWCSVHWFLSWNLKLEKPNSWFPPPSQQFQSRSKHLNKHKINKQHHYGRQTNK